MNDLQPWHRQPYETDAAWLAFTYYQKHRNTTLAYRDHQVAEKGKTEADVRRKYAPSRWNAWAAGKRPRDSKPYPGGMSWADRMLAYENYLIDQRTADRLAALAEYEDRIMSMAMGPLLEKIEEILQWPLAQQVIQGDEENQIIIVKPANWSLRDIGSIIAAFDKVIRLINNKPTDEQQHTVTLQEQAAAMPDEILNDTIANLAQQFFQLAKTGPGAAGNPFAALAPEGTPEEN